MPARRDTRHLKECRHTMGKRVGNGLLARLVRGGMGPKAIRLVTVRSRTTGREYSTPIWLVERSGDRYWVAVFGETNTVRNARVAGRVTLSRGAVREDVRLREVPVSERVPFLRARIGSRWRPDVAALLWRHAAIVRRRIRRHRTTAHCVQARTGLTAATASNCLAPVATIVQAKPVPSNSSAGFVLWERGSTI